ncbi:MAG: glycosyltransferase family 2 protein [bacterium]|nr:glycosyltransferase family 2 protein [bacterium]
MEDTSYLNIGTAKDIKNFWERALYRLFEIIPGMMSWSALFLVILLCKFKPLWISIFIVVFVVFWLFRTIYFSVHLWLGYREMAKKENTDWLAKTKEIPNWERIYHLIVVPMYKEPYKVVRDGFESLIKTDYPKDKLIIVLACEERAGEDVLKTAQRIKEEFGPKFYKFIATWHPANLPGEIGGKGSNETWGAKKAKEEIIDKLDLPYENVIFSSFDADTCVYPGYFSCVAYRYLTAEKPTRTSFQPVPLFTNNMWEAPTISKIFSFSSTFWHTMNQERPEKLITFSSHSMSFKALVEVGFKQTNVVSDDSRIFWQCFLKYDGDYSVQPLYYPIAMDANVSNNFFKTLLNIYKQQKRWAYGVGDIPYFLFGFLKNKKIPLKKKISLGWEVIEGHFSWATASIMIFLLGWLPLVLGGAEFSQTIVSYSLPKVISRIMTLSMAGLVSSVYLSFLLLPPRPPEYGKSKYLVFAFSWLVFPFMMIFFGSLPALDAQTRLMTGRYMGFWVTEKFRKKL